VKVGDSSPEPLAADAHFRVASLHREDDALVRLEKFLDDASMTEQRTVRVIHGFGTGQLRRAIGDWLRTHPSVASFNAAPPDKGGGGVTVVELKE
jgi:DNA mismatch repair protein MutS2